MNSPLRLIFSNDFAASLCEVVDTALPSLTRDYDTVTFNVYLARASQGRWQSRALHSLVAQARESYRDLYGPEVAVFDEYDEKAWVYLAVASYTSQGSSFDEALTLRFVPAAGLPLHSDDLNFYRNTDASRSELLTLLGRSIGSQSTAQTLRGCYSQGRMGAVRPRARDGRVLSGNRHVGLSWCLMLECFLQDSRRARRGCRLLTSQTTENLRMLGARIPTEPCDERLGLEPGSIALDRTPAHVRQLCYGVPTYFLNLKDVSALLRRLIEDGSLSTVAAEAATPEGVPLERALRHPQPHTFEAAESALRSARQDQGVAAHGGRPAPLGGRGGARRTGVAPDATR